MSLSAAHLGMNLPLKSARGHSNVVAKVALWTQVRTWISHPLPEATG